MRNYKLSKYDTCLFCGRNSLLICTLTHCVRATRDQHVNME